MSGVGPFNQKKHSRWLRAALLMSWCGFGFECFCVLATAAAAASDTAESKQLSIMSSTRVAPAPDKFEPVRELWRAELKTPDVQTVIERLPARLRPVSDEQLQSLIDAVIYEHENSHYYNGFAMTDPNLEPNYPRPGMNIPAYYFPLRGGSAGGKYSYHWQRTVPSLGPGELERSYVGSQRDY
jgi:hypothetical protein